MKSTVRTFAVTCITGLTLLQSSCDDANAAYKFIIDIMLAQILGADTVAPIEAQNSNSVSLFFSFFDQDSGEPCEISEVCACAHAAWNTPRAKRRGQADPARSL